MWAFLQKAVRRHRFWFIWLTVIAALAISLYADPDNGQSTFQGLKELLQAFVAVSLAHWSRKALTDYPEADLRTLFREARAGNIGAGLAAMAQILLFGFLLLLFAPRAHAADLPTGFVQYGPVLKAEQIRLWEAHPYPVALAGLVEQESCSSLKSKKCWNPKAQLKSQREEGAGLGQITRAYRADGSLRFDGLADMRAAYPRELGEWSWDNVYDRPELQLRALVLESRTAARAFTGTRDMLQFADAAYNGGVHGTQNERSACKLTAGCDPQQWFGHVEKHCLKSRQPLYGGRSACDINREHVYNVFNIRAPRYVAAWAKL